MAGQQVPVNRRPCGPSAANSPRSLTTMKLRTLLALISACMTAGAAQAATRTVALSGQQAPGAPAGANFTTFYNPPTAAGPVINNAGRIAFSGQAVNGATTYTGIW